MRFHMGISFRFKTLKKFLIPFLIGLLSYFGFSYFNLLVVHAVANTNLDTYYIYDFPTDNFEDYKLGDYSLSDIAELCNNNQLYYKCAMLVSHNNSTHKNYLHVVLLPTDLDYINYWVYGQNNNSTTSTIYTSLKVPNAQLKYIYFNASQTTTNLNNTYNNLSNCLTTNTNCSYTTSSSAYNSTYGSALINNDRDYDLSFYTSPLNMFVYYSNVTIKLGLPTGTSSDLFYKSLLYDGDEIHIGDNVKSYLQTLEPEPDVLFWEIEDLKPIDDFFVSKVDINDISDLEVDIRFKYYDNNMVDDLDFDTYYYGRVDNGTYYSYEKINCLRDGAITYDYDINNNYKVVYSNFRCSSSLTNYDYFYIRFRPRYINTTNNKISNIYMSSTSGYMNQTNEYNGGNFVHIMDYFDNLNNNFEILISTNQQRQYANYYSLDSSIIMSNVNREDNNISNFASDNNMLFGTETNSNVIIYNIDLNNNNLNPLYVYIGDESIISFRDTNNNTFTYYDDTNTLVQSNINNNFQVFYNSYDLNYYFSSVNNFINDIDNDLISFHNLIQTCYDSLDFSIQLIINVLYILGLSYLLFKALRK